MSEWVEEPEDPALADLNERMGRDYMASVKMVANSLSVSDDYARAVLAVLAQQGWLLVNSNEYEIVSEQRLKALRERLVALQDDNEPHDPDYYYALGLAIEIFDEVVA